MSCGAAFVGTASSDGDKQQPFDVSACRSDVASTLLVTGRNFSATGALSNGPTAADHTRRRR